MLILVALSIAAHVPTLLGADTGCPWPSSTDFYVPSVSNILNSPLKLGVPPHSLTSYTLLPT